jgi:hypothetical protein
MAKETPDYNKISVNGILVKDVLKFLDSEKILTKALVPGLLPKGARFRDMQQQFLLSVQQLYDTFLKYKDAGYIKTDTQPLVLGQLSKNTQVLNDFLIASRWMNASHIETLEKKYPSKRSLTKMLDKWLDYDRRRIGMKTTSFKLLTHVNSKTKKSQRFLESDFYNKPLATYPPFEGRLDKVILSIKISVAQAEAILINLLGRYVNDNDILEFPRQEDKDARTLIQYVSGFRTSQDQTVEGIKRQAVNMYKQYQYNKGVEEFRRNQDIAFKTKEEGLQLLKEQREQSRQVQELITARKGDIEALMLEKLKIDNEIASQLSILQSLG